MLSETLPHDMLTDFAEFLRTRPTPEEIRGWHPSEVVQERINELLEKSKEESLSSEERRELEKAAQHELFLRGLKARIRAQDVARS